MLCSGALFVVSKLVVIFTLDLSRPELQRGFIISRRNLVQRALPRVPVVFEHDVERRRRSDDNNDVVGVVKQVFVGGSTKSVVDCVVWKRLGTKPLANSST